MPIHRFLTGAILSVTLGPAVLLAQSKSTPCKPVTPKNAQEAWTMEQSSNKKGCWVRNRATGQLEFVGSSPTDDKPILHSPSKAASADLQPPSVQLAGDAVGRWKITETDTLLPSFWAKGTLAISPTLGVQWGCELQTTFNLKALQWIGPPGKCTNTTAMKKISGACDWKLAKSGPGNYGVRCATGEGFLSGTITIQGNTLTGKVVDRSDEYVVETISFSGDRSVPPPIGQ